MKSYFFKSLFSYFFIVLTSLSFSHAQLPFFDFLTVSNGPSLSYDKPDGGHTNDGVWGYSASATALKYSDKFLELDSFVDSNAAYWSYGLSTGFTIYNREDEFLNPGSDYNFLADILPVISVKFNKYSSFNTNTYLGYSFGSFGNTYQSGITYGIGFDKAFDENKFFKDSYWSYGVKALRSDLNYSSDEFSEDSSGLTTRVIFSLSYIFN